METLAVIIPSLRPGMLATSIDLLDAYLHVSISLSRVRDTSFSIIRG